MNEERTVVVTLPNGNKLSIGAKTGNDDININLSDHLNKEENITEVNETVLVKKALSKDTHNTEQGNSTTDGQKPSIPEKKIGKNKEHGTDSKDWEDFQFTGIPPRIPKNDKEMPRLPTKMSKTNNRIVEEKVLNKSTQSPDKQNSYQLKKLLLPEEKKVKKHNADSVIYEDLAFDGILPRHQDVDHPVPEHFPEERPEDDYDLIDSSDMMKT